MKKLTNEKFIEKAVQIHGGKYNYSKVEYVNARTKICIICPIHGEFWQLPSSHLNGYGCIECGNDKKKSTANEFIEKAKVIHGNEYNYSKVNYVDSQTKVHIICSIHGEFLKTPHSHLLGQGCPECGKRRQTISNIKNAKNQLKNVFDFIDESNKIHGDKYDYSKVEYIKSKKKVCIICPVHGEFWQTPSNHLSGYGCPKCNTSHLERNVMQFLDRHNIEYEYQKRFEWLGRQSLDFYIPKYNIAIECQGIQHFEPVEYFGGEDEFEKIKKNDSRKKQLCEQHNIKLKYYR